MSLIKRTAVFTVKVLVALVLIQLLFTAILTGIVAVTGDPFIFLR